MTRPGLTFSRGFCQPQPHSQPKCCLLPREDGGVRVCVAGGHCNPPGGRHLFCAQKVSQSGKNHSPTVSKKDKIIRSAGMQDRILNFSINHFFEVLCSSELLIGPLIITGSLKSFHFHFLSFSIETKMKVIKNLNHGMAVISGSLQTSI